MSFYEELLSLGQHMHDQERSALYKFLLESEKSRIYSLSNDLLQNGQSRESIANGEIIYSMKGNRVTYSVRKLGTSYIYENIREVNPGFFQAMKIKKVMRFIAQAEVEVIWNFPLPGINPQEATGFGIISYPFWDLRYYSNGRGRILGLIKKLQSEDSEILRKLRAS